MTKINEVPGKVNKEAGRIAKQANAFEFKPWHVFAAIGVIIAIGCFVLN